MLWLALFLCQPPLARNTSGERDFPEIGPRLLDAAAATAAATASVSMNARAFYDLIELLLGVRGEDLGRNVLVLWTGPGLPIVHTSASFATLRGLLSLSAKVPGVLVSS
jgi:hypothetical protein